MKIYRYYGIELDRSQIINYTNVAENELQHSLHVTFKFGLDTDDLEKVQPYLGQRSQICIIGEGAYIKDVDGKSVIANIGWQVDSKSLNSLAELYKNPANPHVTLWINKENDLQGKRIGKAVETKDCQFEPWEPFFIDGTFCVFDENNDAHQSL